MKFTEVSNNRFTLKTWTAEIYKGRNGKDRVNLFQKNGNSQQPIFLGDEHNLIGGDTILYDFVPPKYVKKALYKLAYELDLFI